MVSTEDKLREANRRLQDSADTCITELEAENVALREAATQVEQEQAEQILRQAECMAELEAEMARLIEQDDGYDDGTREHDPRKKHECEHCASIIICASEARVAVLEEARQRVEALAQRWAGSPSRVRLIRETMDAVIDELTAALHGEPPAGPPLRKDGRLCRDCNKPLDILGCPHCNADKRAILERLDPQPPPKPARPCPTSGFGLEPACKTCGNIGGPCPETTSDG